MTEYEAATLAARHAALWISGAHVLATLIVGAAQCLLVWFGIRLMAGANRERAAALALQRRDLEQQRREADQRHTETMRALEVLIERTAARGTGQ